MKHSGDTIDAKFSNIVVKYGSYLSNDKTIPMHMIRSM